MTMTKKPKATWNGFSLRPRKEMPEGLWMNCPGCEHMLYSSAVEKNLNVCPECDYHFRVGAPTRIQYLVDEGSFQQVLEDMTTADPLDFKFRDTTYKERVKADEKKSGAKEAMLIGKAFIKGRGVILAVMEPNFLMGSMGAVVGEKLCVAVEQAMEESLPLVVVSCSGGARMHEGVVSLGQMAKTAAAIARLDDVIVAEPGALIGFAGPRTIAETIKVELPEGFQTAEFMLEHGFVDMIAHRKDLRSEIARIIDYSQK